MTNDAVALSSNVIQHDLSSSRSKTVGRILLGIFGGVGVGLTVLALPFVTPALRKHALPYVPATKEQITNIFHLLKNRNRQIQSLVDLGSGDGRIVFESIKQGFKQSTGIELNRVLLYYSRIYALINGGRYPLSSWNFKRANIWKHDLSKYENIVIFGVDSMMEPLLIKLSKEICHDGVVVTCRYQFPIQFTKTTGEGIDTVWLYDSKSIRQYSIQKKNQ